MMATRKPKEVKTSDTGVLWYMAREIATGIEPLMDGQLQRIPLALQSDLLQHQEEPFAVNVKGLPSSSKALVHSKRHVAT